MTIEVVIQKKLPQFDQLYGDDDKCDETSFYKNSRFEFINRILTANGSDELEQDGHSIVDDGEDSFLIAYDSDIHYEHLLLAQKKDGGGKYIFGTDKAILCRCRFTPETSRLVQVDFNRLNLAGMEVGNIDEDKDWITLFYDHDSSDLLEEVGVKLDGQEQVEALFKEWYKLSPLES